MANETDTLRPISTLGFIGLGVMGEPMCGHLARRAGRPVLAHDLRQEPLARLADHGVKAAQLAEIADECDLILLSLPDGKAVASVVAALEPHLGAGQCVVDTSTSSVALSREIGARLAARGIGYADAPVARTREAAARGELSIMVGAADAVFAHIQPVLETMGTDVTHCGPIGCGQVVKILNNMLVFQAYSGSGRGDRDRPAQRRAAGGAAADHRQGIRRQLRAAQPRDEVHAAARLP